MKKKKIGTSSNIRRKKSSANRHSAFGPVINPHSLNQENKRLAGGSSGGSAASVAMNMCRV